MKKTPLLIILSILFLNATAFGQLTQTDLDKIEKMFTASEARMKEYIDLKIDALDAKLTGQIDALDKKFTGQIDALDKKFTGEIKAVKEEIKAVDGRVTQIFGFLIALIGLIAVAVGLPQYLLARRSKEMQIYIEKIDELSREIEKLKQQRIVSS